MEDACRSAGATELLRARDEAERAELWRVRRELSLSLRTIAPLKFNHDVVVPKGRIPDLFALVRRIKSELRLRIPLFGHAGDGNIHVNIMVDPDDGDEIARGLVNYASGDARRIARRPSADIESILGFVEEAELIHRDNLVVL